jgi:ribosomal protein S27E
MTNGSDSHLRPGAALAVFCRNCSSPLVQASGWMQQGEAHWKVRLWCPECWHEQGVLLDRAQAAYLSLAVEEGFASVIEAFEGIDAIVTAEPGAGREKNPS